MDKAVSNQLPYLSKTTLFWGALAAFAFVVYRLAIGPTLDTIESYYTMSEKSKLADYSTQQMDHLEQELLQFENKLSDFQTDSNRTDPLLARLIPVCKESGARLDALPSGREHLRNGQLLVTRPVRLQGDYHSLVKALYQMEYRLGAGRVSSVQFFSQQAGPNTRRQLYVNCYIEFIRKDQTKPM